MQTLSIDLVWIVVKDLKKAIQFYTEVVGLKLMEYHEQYNWAEVQGYKGGARLGIAQDSEAEDVKPGQNGVVTFRVENIETSIQHMKKKGAECIGKLIEIPGHVKMQTMKDNDGNHFQMVQTLEAHSCAHC